MQLDNLQLSQKQKIAIATSNAKVNIWHGAVRSGKTYSSLIRFLIEIAEAPPGLMLILCRDVNAFRRNVLDLLHQLVGNDASFIGNYLLQIWGREVHVVGAHDSRAEGRIRGPTFVGAYVDEASLIPESAWVILVQRCAMGEAKIFATTNPAEPSHWMKKNFIDGNSDVQSFHFTMLDNPALKEKDRNYLERQHRGLWYKRFVLGEWCLAEGAIFDFFDETVHTISKAPANAKFYLVGVDVGFTNPTAFTMIGFNDDANPCLWVEREYLHDAKEKGMKTESDYARDLVEFCSSRHNVRGVFIDPAAKGFRVEVRRNCHTLPLLDVDNDVLGGIRFLTTLLGDGDLKICRTCPKLIGEIQSYVWDPRASERGEDAPLKRGDHLIDSMRYATYSYFGKRTEMKEAEPTAVSGRTLGFGTLRQQLGSQYPGPRVIQGDTWDYAKDAFHGQRQQKKVF